MWKIQTNINEILIIQFLLLFFNLLLLSINKDITLLNFTLNYNNIFYSIIFSLLYLLILLIFKNNIFIFNNNTNSATQTPSFNLILEKYNTLEYQIIIFINYLSSLLLLFNYDIFTLYLLIELFSFSLFILLFISFTYNLSFIVLSYFIISTISSLFLLYSIYLLYLNYGLLNLFDIYHLYNILPNTFFINYFIIILLFKLGAAPLHFWLISLYNIVNTKITIYLSIIPKFIYIYLINKFICFNYSLNIILLFSILSLIIGSIFGLKESLFKKILANSSILNIGFILIGYYNLKINKELIEYLLIYSINTIQFFLIYLFIYNNQSKYLTLSNSSLSSKKSFIFIIFNIYLIISLLSFIGLPPLAGFYAKWNIYSLLLSNNINFILFIFILISIFSIILSSNYYLFILKYLYISPINTKFSISNTILKKNTIVLPNTLSILLSITTLILLLYSLLYPLISPIFQLFI